MTVCEPTDPAQLAFVESLLRHADIPFVTQASNAQNLIGGGQIGGANVAVGPPLVQVSAADAPWAVEVLEQALPTTAVDEAPQPGETTPAPAKYSALVAAAPFALVVIAAVTALIVPPGIRLPAGIALAVATLAVGYYIVQAGRRHNRP